MNKNSIDVINREAGWVLKTGTFSQLGIFPDSGEPVYATQALAIEAGKKLAEEQKSVLYIFSEKNKLKKKHDYRDQIADGFLE